MKVIVVTPIYPSPDNPQAGIFIHRQIVRLREQGADCHVLVFRPAPPPFPRWLVRRSWLRYYAKSLFWSAPRDGIGVDTVFYDRRWTPGEDVVPQIGEALARHVADSPDCAGADVVYAHFLWPGAAAALEMRTRVGLPVVGIARGSEMHEWQATNPHCKGHVSRVLMEADCVLANCEDLRMRANELVAGVSERIGIVYNGCDSEWFAPAADRGAARAALGFDERQKVAVFCGSIEERKGISELAEGWDAFSTEHSEWRLIALGQLTDRALAKRLTTAGNGSVTLKGRVSPDTLLRYLQAADAYLQPSRLEGLANATMEAMSVGLPVVATDVCGQRELICNGENGWLVPSEDAGALRRALEELASNPEIAARCGRAARKTIESRFNPRLEAAKLNGVLREVASRRFASEPVVP